jgi:DNA repair protein RecO (recombination protein O)
MEAIILKKSVYSEGSEIITLFTRDGGKVRASARSVKSSKSRLAFGLQALFYSDVDLAPSKHIPVIKGVRPIETFSKIRENEKLVYNALYAVEVILKSTADEQPNTQLFDLLLNFLRHLNNFEGLNHCCVAIFSLKALALSGYELQFDRCVVCDRSLQNSDQIAFSNYKSGFLCSEHQRATSDSVVIRPELWDVLRRSTIESYEEVDSSGVTLNEIQSFANSFVTHILERNLNLGKYMV